jgi:hypothetical protein
MKTSIGFSKSSACFNIPFFMFKKVTDLIPLPSVLGTPQNDFYLAQKSLKSEMKIKTNALNCIA